MPSDLFLAMGDKLQILFTPPTVVCPTLASPVPLVASGFAAYANKPVCVQGDELAPLLKVPNVYTNAAFTIPGMLGSPNIVLNPNNLTVNTQDSHRPLLLVGAPFTLVFPVKQPAQQPSPTGPIPDPMAAYIAKGTFIPSQATFRLG